MVWLQALATRDDLLAMSQNTRLKGVAKLYNMHELDVRMLDFRS